MVDLAIRLGTFTEPKRDRGWQLTSLTHSNIAVTFRPINALTYEVSHDAESEFLQSVKLVNFQSDETNFNVGVGGSCLAKTRRNSASPVSYHGHVTYHVGSLT